MLRLSSLLAVTATLACFGCGTGQPEVAPPAAKASTSAPPPAIELVEAAKPAPVTTSPPATTAEADKNPPADHERVSENELFERVNSFVDEGEYNGALDYLTQVLADDPQNFMALTIRGSLNSSLRNYQQAIDDFEHSIALHPKHTTSTDQLAWILATCQEDELRNGKRAIELVRGALQTIPQSWKYNDTLAAALAETGDFPAAMEALGIAIKNAPEDQQAELAKRLESYQNGQPWRE